jgi:hypothetical protein
MDPKKLPSLSISWTQYSDLDAEINRLVDEILAYAEPVDAPEGFAEMLAAAETDALLKRLMLPK